MIVCLVVCGGRGLPTRHKTIFSVIVQGARIRGNTLDGIRGYCYCY
jgi:hypothetical protein